MVLLLLLISSNVMAEWTRVTGSFDGDYGDYGDYVDVETIKKKNNKVKMWSLLDFKTAKIVTTDNKRSLSAAVHYEYDCEEETYRLLDMYFYSGNMKTGEVVYYVSNIKEETTSILPDSLNRAFFNIACGKK